MARKLQPVVKWQGLAPDADPTTPGVLTLCTRVIPNERGIIAAPWSASYLTGQVAGLPAAAVAARYVSPSGASPILMAATEQRLFYRNGAWTEVTRAGGYPAASTLTCWTLETFGNVVLAANGIAAGNGVSTTRLQASAGGTAQFADVAGSPRASIVVACSRFVMLLNVNDAAGGFGAGDAWWCSARDDHTNWTLAAGGSTRGRLVDSAGCIGAAIEFNNSVYAFKLNSIYRGDFVPGSTEVWTWTKLPHDVGCQWPHAVTKDSSRIYFHDQGEVYAFDGVNIVPLMAGKIKRWLISEFPGWFDIDVRVQLAYDKFRNGLWVLTRFGCLFFHIPSGQWGMIDRGQLYEAITAQIIGETTRYSSITAIRSPDHRAVSLGGGADPGAPNATFTTGDIGDPREMIETIELRPVLVSSVGTVSANISARDLLEAPSDPTMGPFFMTPDGKIELSVNARWLRATIQSTGAFESIGYATDLSAQGAP